jgi:hypothetical protein
VSVRARNSKVLSPQLYCIISRIVPLVLMWHTILFLLKVLFATCFDHSTLSELEGYHQKLLSFKPTSSDITYRYFKLFFELHGWWS